MDFELKALSAQQASQTTADALIVLVPIGSTAQASDVNALQRLVQDAARQGDFDVTEGKCLCCYRPAGLAATYVVLVGVQAGSLASVRKAVASAMVPLKTASIKKLMVCMALLDANDLEGNAVRVAMQAVADGSYVYATTKPSAKARALKQVVMAVNKSTADLQASFRVGQALVQGVEFAKEWANRPANHATPTHLAEAARKLGRKPQMKTEVMGLKEVTALGMGAFLAVAMGSAQPLRFIVMHYRGGAKGSAPVVLVGKGITFDTGGISIKPAPDMDEMKFDMGGAASVLGTFAALAELQPSINVVGVIPACENMPDGLAIKPGDVVTSMSGQTIEILNTDAEGRLILCDALTYVERFKPHSVIDIATLTGACVIALGGVRSGLFSPHEALASSLLKAGEGSLDLCWRLPLDDEYADGLKSNFADMGNVAGRAAGAITAAKFLQKFTGKLPWAHLDIAGVAWKSGAAKGSTGRPVPLLVHYLLDVAQTQAQDIRAKKPQRKPLGAKSR